MQANQLSNYTSTMPHFTTLFLRTEIDQASNQHCRNELNRTRTMAEINSFLNCQETFIC